MFYLHVVISTRMNTREAVAVFSGQEKASAFVVASEAREYKVEKWPVEGDYTYPGPVYVAQTLEARDDVHVSLGLYASAEEAGKAAGPGGHTLRLMPDSR